VFVPSEIPDNLGDHFANEIAHLRDERMLKHYLETEGQAFVIIDVNDYEATLKTISDLPVHELMTSELWRREARKKNFKSISHLLKLDFRGLSDLYRQKVVLISNQPSRRK